MNKAPVHLWIIGILSLLWKIGQILIIQIILLQVLMDKDQ